MSTLSETVYFTSMRPLYRAENIRAVYDAYDGDKEFVQMDASRSLFVKGVVVTDEYLSHAGKDTSVIMIGHGIPGGKHYGYDMKWRYVADHEASVLDWVICASHDTINIVAEQSHVSPAQVLPLGMPRTDQYFTKTSGDTVLKHAKRSYLYLPTFRNNYDADAPEIDYEAIDALLEDGEVFAVKPHMIDGDVSMDQFRHIVDLGSYEESAPYLLDADVIITDYSSVMFDVQILQKPLVLFAKDANAYMSTRGMYFDYPSGYASNYATSEEELVKVMRNAKRGPEDEQCRLRCCASCDGRSTDRVIALIKKELEWRRGT